MDHEEKVPAASIAEVERFWADGQDAKQPSSETNITSDRPLPFDLLCVQCGERGGKWNRGSVVILNRPVELARNMRVAQSSKDVRIYIWTHACPVRIDMPGVGAVPLAESSSGFAPGRVSAGDGIEVVRTPDPVAGSDYRAIARDLLRALYTMIGHFGMPIKNKEAADEVEVALKNAEAAKVDEVVL